MACFLVPAAEAIVATAAKKVIEKKESAPAEVKISVEGSGIETVEKTSFSKKLSWLTRLLWGGSILLAFEHLWHGEIVPWFPFLTATSNATDTAEMLHEMATAGVAMAILVTAIWVCMLVASSVIEKRAVKQEASKSAE